MVAPSMAASDLTDGRGGANGAAPAVRVLVAGDQELIREAIAAVLATQPGVGVVGTARDAAQVVESAVTLRVDVVLMDLADGPSATVRLRRELPACRVVILAASDDQEYVVQALRAGVAGYLVKDVPAVELASALRLVHAGICQFSVRAAGWLAAAAAGHPAPASNGAVRSVPGHAGSGLTARETDVLRMVARGATNREIATDLFLSQGTVKNHISRILARLGLRDRTHAAIYARDRGLI